MSGFGIVTLPIAEELAQMRPDVRAATYRHLRERQGLSKAELGRRVGTSGSHISSIERRGTIPTNVVVRENYFTVLGIRKAVGTEQTVKAPALDRPAMTDMIVEFAAACVAEGREPSEELLAGYLMAKRQQP